MTLNRAFGGSAYLFDHSGVFVTAVDLMPLWKAMEQGNIPTDGAGMFQVRIAWDGRDAKAHPVASGIYVMRLVLTDPSHIEATRRPVLNKVFSFGIKRPR